MNKLLIACCAFAFGSVYAQIEVIPGPYSVWYPNVIPDCSIGWSGLGATRGGNALAVDSDEGVVYSAAGVRPEYEIVRTLVSFSASAMTEDDLASVMIPDDAKFAACCLRKNRNECFYAFYAKTAEEGLPRWTKLEGLTPSADAENRFVVEYNKATNTIRVIGATNAVTFYAIGKALDIQYKTMFKGEGRVSELSAKRAKMTLAADDIPVNLPFEDVKAAFGSDKTQNELAGKLAETASNGFKNYENLALGIPQDPDKDFTARPYLKAGEASAGHVNFSVNGITPKTDDVAITYSVESSGSVDFTSPATEASAVAIGTLAQAALPAPAAESSAVKYFRVKFDIQPKADN